MRAGYGRVEDLGGCFPTGDGKARGVEQAQLYQDGGLVPVDVLVGDLPVLHSDDDDEGNRDRSPGAGPARLRIGNGWTSAAQKPDLNRSRRYPVRWVTAADPGSGGGGLRHGRRPIKVRI